jgi:formylglycine-generating enzyme required for sulfatase activity
MARVPGGVIRIGATDLSDASPVHEVQINAFSIDRTEVTVSAYSQCVDAGICTPPRGLLGADSYFCTWGNRRTIPTHPVNCVDWNQASQFCQWAGKRLPIEEEWEYAARGGDFRKYPWGNGDPQRGSLCWDRGGSTYTCPVGSIISDMSPFGLYDMAGNVEEWTASRHCPYSNPACGANQVVIRGGNSGYRSYGPFLDLVRTARRRPANPSTYDQNKGFRCAR